LFKEPPPRNPTSRACRPLSKSKARKEGKYFLDETLHRPHSCRWRYLGTKAWVRVKIGRVGRDLFKEPPPRNATSRAYRPLSGSKGIKEGKFFLG